MASLSNKGSKKIVELTYGLFSSLFLLSEHRMVIVRFPGYFPDNIPMLTI